MEAPPRNDQLDSLGRARITPAELDAVVGRALGRTVTVTDCQVDPLPINAITTEAVLHLHGSAVSGSEQLPWDLLVKIFRSPRHWPLLLTVPEQFRRTFIDGYPWRGEVDLRAAGVAELMPDGLRLPTQYRCDDLGDDRLALWTEWIDAESGGWELARYRRAATLIGRMTARWRTLPGVSADVGGRTQLRRIVEGPIMLFAVPRIADPGLVAHPLFAGSDARAVFADLAVLGGRLLPLLDHLETLPRSIGHGDACPQNLLVAVDDPDTIVAIDLSWPHPEAVGYDLGQLLIGHAHSGELAIEALPVVHDEIIEAFVAGLRQENFDVPADDVRFAFDTALVIRSAYQSLPLERLGDPATPELIEFTARRVALTRYLTDVGLAIRC